MYNLVCEHQEQREANGWIRLTSQQKKVRLAKLNSQRETKWLHFKNTSKDLSWHSSGEKFVREGTALLFTFLVSYFWKEKIEGKNTTKN